MAVTITFVLQQSEIKMFDITNVWKYSGHFLSIRAVDLHVRMLNSTD